MRRERFGRSLGPAIALTIFVLVPPLPAGPPVTPEEIVRTLADEVSGETARRFTDAISKFDRIQAAPGYHDAAVWVKGELERAGYKNVTLEGWPSDGTKRYSTYRSVIGWKASKGELWMTSPVRERLCSYAELPLTLVGRSRSASVEAELVDVGTGIGKAAYEGKDVRGKIVLATGAPAEVMRQAVMVRGAHGILTYFAPDTRPGYPNLVRYASFWPRWEDRDRIGFGFNLSKNQGAALKRRLEEGQRIVLGADVASEFFPSSLEVLSTAFPGSAEPEKEVMLIAHLCHPMPCANDNASGSGGLMEMARALKVLVDKGLLAAPKRTIRFVWVPEFNGTVPYVLAHPESVRNTLAVINCDMIGEDLHKTGGVLNIFGTPDSVPSFLNDVAARFAGLVEERRLTSLNGSTHPFVWRLRPYGGGSDHVVFNDGSLKVPAIMLNRDDLFHHTSLDDMDKVDPTELRRSSVLALATAYAIAAAGDTEAADTARLVARNGVGRLSADYYDALAGLYAAGDPEGLHRAYRQVLNVVTHAARRESLAVASAGVLASDTGVKRDIAALGGHIGDLALSFPKEAGLAYKRRCAEMGTAPKPPGLSGEERELARLVPVRSSDFVGPLENDYLEEKLGPGIFEEVGLRGDAAYEALNFADGKKSLHEIALAVSAEFGPVSGADVRAFFMVLERAGLVILKKV